jgi:hypothetical protein
MKSLTVVVILLLLGGLAQAQDSHGSVTPLPTGSVTPLPTGGATPLPTGGAMPAMPPTLVTGSIAVKVIQGTKGGPKIGPDEVIVELYGHGGKIFTSETKLDVHGVSMIEDLPLGVPFRPRVTVKHGGRSYTQDGEAMNAENPTQDITITVFETSDKAPEWEVVMWNVILQPLEKGGVEVFETIVARNPSDAAYLGAPDADGRRVSVAFTLPEGAQNVQMGGELDASYASIVGNRLLSRAALKPGPSHFRLQYTLPTPGGEVSMNFVAPAAVKQIMVFVPEAYKEGVQSDILKPGQPGTIQHQPVQPYITSNVSTGQKIQFSLGGLPGPVIKTSYIPHVLAALGCVILFVPCIVVLLMRRPETEVEVEAA